ncbi:MAG: isopentenyl phosphate kinase family protein [Nitrosopumilus sp.]|nr:isopentenyl phosphate kinase family protein [Nitrosopumilus sp.]
MDILKNNNLLIIKLGGSVITFKEKPLTPNLKTIEKIARIIKELRELYKIIIVHGGGSFGHYWSVKYDMHTKPSAYPDEGISRVRESMIELNHMIVEKFISMNLKPFSINASSFIFNNIACKERISDIMDMMKNNDIIPMTYGDVVHTSGGNFSILSGDTLMNILSIYLNPKFSIFTTNVDGIYNDLKGGHIISNIVINKNKDLLNANAANIEFSNMSFDVTGGMKRKMNESINIAKAGIPVYLINGFYPERMLDIINGGNFIGTLIKKQQEAGA